MSKLLRAGGLLLLVGAMVWLVTLWQWQTSGREVAMADIVVQLLLLPVVLVGALLLAGWAVQRMRQPVPTATAVDADAAVPSQSMASDDAAARPQAWLVAQAVSTTAADDVGALLQRVQRGDVSPTLDPELTDAQGLPIFSGRGTEDDPVTQSLVDHDAGALIWPIPADGLPWSVGARRALWLLKPVLASLLDALHQLPPADEHTDAAGASARPELFESGPNHLSGVARPVTAAMVQAQADRAPVFTVRLILPATWRDAERDSAVQWLREQAADVLDWARSQRAQGIRWVTDVLPEPDQIWPELDQLLVQWSRESRPQACLLLSCDSALDADRVAQWQATGSLFTAQHQRGRIPGEAAGGVLLVHHGWPGLAAPHTELQAVRLLQPCRARRDKSADAIGRTSHQHLLALLRATQRAVVPQSWAEQVLLLSDADHRASRVSELYEALQEVAPDLDLDTQVMRPGIVCGDLGQARPVVMLALTAASLAQEPAWTAALAVVLDDACDRAVVPLVRSWPPAAAFEPSAAPASADAVPA